MRRHNRSRIQPGTFVLISGNNRMCLIRKRRSPKAELRAAASRAGSETAFGTVLTALRSAATRGASMAAVRSVQAIRDPYLRDTAYRVYRLRQTPEEVAISQGLRTITVRQNIRRLQRSVPEGELLRLVSGQVEPPLADLSTVIVNPLESDWPGHVADAFASAAWQEVRETVLGIGKRSIRSVRGRVWIEPSMPRQPAANLKVAESGAEYGSTRTFDIRKEDQGWEVRVALSEHGIAVYLLSDEGVVVCDSSGSLVGVCTPDSPSLPLPGITLPADILIRRLGS
jgi:hypothetical protein